MTMVIILICRLTYVSRDYGTYNICLMCLILSLHSVGYMYCLICEHYYHICFFFDVFNSVTPFSWVHVLFD